MTKLAELRHERDQLSAKANEINKAHPNDRSMPKAASQELDGLLNQIERVDAQLDVCKATTQNSTPGWKDEDGKDLKAMRTGADFRAHYASLGNGAMRGEEPPRLDDFLKGVARMKTTPSVQNALSVGTDSNGGYAVPSVVMPGILEALVPASALLTAGAGIIALSEGAKSFTTAAVDSIPTAGWRLESGTVPESSPTFRAVVAVPRSLSFFFKCSRELLMDAPNINGALYQIIAQAFAKELDRAGLIGTGTAPEPRGLLNTTNVQSVTNGAKGASLVSNRYANLFSGVQALLQADAPMPTAFIMSPRTKVGFAALVDSTTQPLEVPAMLADIPMIATSQISNALTVGTSSDCSQIFMGDFSRVSFMMREAIHIQLVDQLYAGTGEIGFFAHIRADVAVQYPKAFAVVTGVRP